MKRIRDSVYQRGVRGQIYVRKRIPAALRHAYPPHKREIVVSLGTNDFALVKDNIHTELARIEAEFKEKRRHGLRFAFFRASCTVFLSFGVTFAISASRMVPQPSIFPLAP
jgi:uncharacterized protein DUF6538